MINIYKKKKNWKILICKLLLKGDDENNGAVFAADSDSVTSASAAVGENDESY